MSTPESAAAAGPELSLVIPVLDEAENIPEVVAEIEEKLRGRLDYEVVFVDDGSRDETVARILEAAARDPRIRLVRHRGNRGKSAGLVTGAQHARAPWIATMDGDGQNDPVYVEKLFARTRAADAPPDLGLVAGRRLRREDTWLKQVSSRIGNGVRMRILGDPIPDAACGLKVFRRREFLELPRFDNMHRFLSALFRRHGMAVESVAVQDRPRAHGDSKYGLHNRLWVGIGDLVGMLWLQRRPLPPAPLRDDREET